MSEPARDEELRVSYPVRQLIEELGAKIEALGIRFDKRLDELSRELGSRATIAALELLRSDLGTLADRQAKLEQKVRDATQERRGFLAAAKEFRGLFAWVIATALAALYLYAALRK